jgi:hypothetical protein
VFGAGRVVELPLRVVVADDETQGGFVGTIGEYEHCRVPVGVSGREHRAAPRAVPDSHRLLRPVVEVVRLGFVGDGAAVLVALVRERDYTDASIRISDTRPESSVQRQAIANSARLQRQLWSLAGQAVNESPADTAPRLYIETLNESFDAQSTRVSSLSNRVPTAVLVLELLVAAVALATLGLYLSTMGRGVLTVLVAAVLVTLTLLVTFDLDRPTRGLIEVPDGPLVQVRASMNLPPAARAPAGH